MNEKLRKLQKHHQRKAKNICPLSSIPRIISCFQKALEKITRAYREHLIPLRSRPRREATTSPKLHKMNWSFEHYLLSSEISHHHIQAKNLSNHLLLIPKLGNLLSPLMDKMKMCSKALTLAILVSGMVYIQAQLAERTGLISQAGWIN